MVSSLIAVDWGSTNLRVKLVVEGELLESRECGQGIKNVGEAAFEDILYSLCGDWKTQRPELPVVMSGMIGSREGWVEVPYCRTAIGIEALVGELVPVQTQALGELLLVPGLRHDFTDGTTDVMRGEETEVLGLLAGVRDEQVTVCGPGTHSKWVNCQAGEIVSFRTWFTGEAFEKLTQDSLISGSCEGLGRDIDEGAFVRGLEHSGRTGGLLHHLFLGRTDMLTKRVSAEHLPSLISGVLIGHEIREARKFAIGQVHLIENNRSAELYGKAFDYFEIAYLRSAQDVHLAGIMALMKQG